MQHRRGRHVDCTRLRVAHAPVRGHRMGVILAANGSGNAQEQGGEARAWR
jgi:hypothetical protein